MPEEDGGLLFFLDFLPIEVLNVNRPCANKNTRNPINMYPTTARTVVLHQEYQYTLPGPCMRPSLLRCRAHQLARVISGYFSWSYLSSTPSNVFELTINFSLSRLSNVSMTSENAERIGRRLSNFLLIMASLFGQSWQAGANQQAADAGDRF